MQTLFEMSQVPIRVTSRRDTLVDLKHPHRRPRNLRSGQRAQHHPRSMASAYGE
jgi:hypothetical protein